MRIECSFFPSEIPITYHFFFNSFIKQALSCSSKEYFENLYYYKDKKNKQSKSFSFSIYANDFTITNNIIKANGGIKWLISSYDPEFIIHLYNGLLTLKDSKYKNDYLELDYIQFVKEKLPITNEATFKTLSPIVIKNKDGQFISPSHPEFEQSFSYICNKTLENSRGTGLKQPLTFTDTNMTKQVVKQKHDKFKYLNKEGLLYINANRGTFKVKGDIEDLKSLTKTGFGFRRSQGFGNVKVLHG